MYNPITRDYSYSESDIDSKMRTIIKDLNDLGITTFACCEGHITIDKYLAAYIAIDIDLSNKAILGDFFRHLIDCEERFEIRKILYKGRSQLGIHAGRSIDLIKYKKRLERSCKSSNSTNETELRYESSIDSLRNLNDDFISGLEDVINKLK